MDKKERGASAPYIQGAVWTRRQARLRCQCRSPNPKERTDWRNVCGATACARPTYWFFPNTLFPFCIFLFLFLSHAHFSQKSVAITGDASLYLHER